MEIQALLFQKVKELLPAHRSLPDVVAELFEVSTDSAYRRIRGETKLSLEEAAKLCAHFNLSFDELTRRDKSVLFSYTSMQSEKDFAHYLESFIAALEALSRHEKPNLVYAAEDMPIFHHFSQREHASFKMFYWMQSVLNLESFRGKRFEVDLIPNYLTDLGARVYELYCSVPSVEIWSEDALESTLKQILFCYESGLFYSAQDAVLVSRQLLLILDKLMEQTENACKRIGSANNFQVYVSEVQIGNNTVLVSAGKHRSCYLRNQTFNTMTTSHQGFCEETEQFLGGLIKKSVLISGVSAKRRFQFFQKIFAQVSELEKKLV
jgi:hypothetical protein